MNHTVPNIRRTPRAARLRQALLDDTGAATAEYAIATLAQVGH